VYHVLATRSTPPRYTVRTEVAYGPPIHQDAERGWVVHVALRNTGVQPLRKVTFAVTNALAPRDGGEGQWKVEGDIHNVPPGKSGQVTIPLNGYESGRRGERMPRVEVTVSGMEW
jgi:hypothetical protein